MSSGRGGRKGFGARRRWRVNCGLVLLSGAVLLLLSVQEPPPVAVADEQDPKTTVAAASERHDFDESFYLPFIRSTVAGPPPALLNGGFENGPDGTWVELSLGEWPIILPAYSLPVIPHSGNWAAWLGGAPDELSYLEQSVTVPEEAPYLSYWYWIASVDNCGFDEATIIVNGDDVVSAYHLCEDTNTAEWAEASVDLSTYAGEIVLLQFRVETDGSLNSNFFLDDARFVAEPSMRSR